MKARNFGYAVYFGLSWVLLSPCSYGCTDLQGIAQSLSVDNPLRMAIQSGAKGLGNHQSWMDGMKRANIRSADFTFRFKSRPGGVKLHVESQSYLRQYYEPESRVTDGMTLASFRSSGLYKELRRAALKEALARVRRVLQDIGTTSATGKIQVVLLDDECLPTPSGPPEVHATQTRR